MAGKWQSVALLPSVPSGAFNAEKMLLLTDGNVVVHYAYNAEWLLFVPDPQQRYVGARGEPSQQCRFRVASSRPASCATERCSRLAARCPARTAISRRATSTTLVDADGRHKCSAIL